MRDEPTPAECKYVPESVRLQLPLRSVMNLRRVAEELRGLAYRLDTISRFQPDPPSTALLEAAQAIHRTQKNIAAIRYRGRPRLDHLRKEYAKSRGWR